MTFADASTFKEVPYGKGRIFWAAYPVELAQGSEASASLYNYVAARIGLAPQFEVISGASPGVLIYPVVLEDAVLYVMESDSAEDAQLDIRDHATGAKIALLLRSQHAAMALLDRRTKAVIAKYGY